MTYQQLGSGLNAFSPFLQEITNSNILGSENKENIHPALLVRHSGNGKGGCKNGSRSTGSHVQPCSPSIVSGFSTPITNRHRPHHTGLTPGNNSTRIPRHGDAMCHTNVSVANVSLLTGSDVGDANDSGFFSPLNPDTSTVTAAAAAVEAIAQQSKLCELFEGCVPLPQQPRSLNTSVDSVLLPRNVLQEIDDDDSIQSVNECMRTNTSIPPSATETDDALMQLQQSQPVFPVPQLFAVPQPLRQPIVTQHDGPPPEYPRVGGSSNKNRQTVTRVVSGPSSLIAVGGRRVPIDKLHLLLRPSTPERDSDGAAVLSGSVPLVPSARPTPSAKAVKVVASPAPGVPGSVGRHLPSPPPPNGNYHQQQETIVLEFPKGVLMRFQPNASQPFPVMGRRYLAAVRSSRSPYDNVAYEDAGFCVHMLRHYPDGSGAGAGAALADKAIYDGRIIREVDDNLPADVARMRELGEARKVATLECRKHFRFLNLPFELVDVQYTFDLHICIVYYRIQPQEGTSSQPNVARLMRMLQFKLKSKVYLKRTSDSE
ncbi:ESAG8-associated protein [Trypanosoma grayi]|uniref:ESAG8-associated protein n=1 Tax=Trypanosoma grayi TaxID=71804 RepID=UPI0004F4AFE5|nr:ESAG8-associated protein [Trypanosoma grayi]KEG12309.1 ESAG8-associated protein [Trypanosoma grayi]